MFRTALLGLVVAACTQTTNPGAPTLIATSPEPPGANCAAGGVAIQTGVDDDTNGTLDASEVDSISYVCQPAATPGALVRVDPEPIGPNCANGGNAIHSGIDTNGNGTLDPSEITATSYVCTGNAGPATLIRVDPEPAGVYCVNGGQTIKIGPDLDDDSVLDDSEVTSTSYVCTVAATTNPTVIQGNVIVMNSIDAAALVGVQQITGNLTVDAQTLTSIDLTTLRRVDGTMTFTNYGGSFVALPNLDFTDGLSTPANVTTLTAPKLVTTGTLTFRPTTGGVLDVHVLTTASSLSIAGTANVDLSAVTSLWSLGVWGATNVDLSAVTSLAGGFACSGCGTVDISAVTFVENGVFSATMTVDASALVTATYLNVAIADPLFQFPSLTHIGTLLARAVGPNAYPALTSLDKLYVDSAIVGSQMPNLTSIGFVEYASTFAVSMPQITSITGTFRVVGSSGSLSMSNLVSIGEELFVDQYAGQTLSFPALTTVRSVYMQESHALHSVSFPLLTTVAERFVIYNCLTLGLVQLPSLTTIGHLELSSDPALPRCQAQAIVNASHPTNSLLYNLDDTAICP